MKSLFRSLTVLQGTFIFLNKRYEIRLTPTPLFAIFLFHIIPFFSGDCFPYVSHLRGNFFWRVKRGNFQATVRTKEEEQQCMYTFSHPQRGSIDFNTVNPSLPRGMDFLIHPCRWIDDEENVRTPPKLGRYWKNPSPPPSRFPNTSLVLVKHGYIPGL